jgi:hypothetical protein
MAMAIKGIRPGPLLGVAVAALTFCVNAQPAADPAREQVQASLREYRKAVEAWAALPHIPADDLLRLAPARLMSRLTQAEAARAAVSEAKEKAMETLRSYLGSQREHLRSIPAPPSLLAMDEADQSLLADLGAWGAYEDVIAAGASTQDRNVVAAATLRKSGLLDLQSAVYQRRREMGRLSSDLTGLAGWRANLDSAYSAVSTLMAEREAEPKHEAEQWRQLFAELKGPQLPKPESPAPAPTSAAMPADRVLLAQGEAVVPSIAGVWILNNPEAKKLPDGSYEPVSVRIQISQNGDAVQGDYLGTYAVPPEETYNPTVRFAFKGRITSPIMRFAIESPLKGSILIVRSGSTRIHVSYVVENAAQHGISFASVSEENPQVLDRKAN